MPRRYAIIGTGALGGYFGARLHHAGCEVHFLLHSDYEHVKAHGLRVDSVDGDLSIARLHAHRRPEDVPPCDIALVCLKTTRNHLLPDILPHVLKEGGAAVMMQNGLGVEERAAEVVGPGRVLGAMAFICSYKAGPGHIRHDDYGRLTIGGYDPGGGATGPAEAVRRVVEDFERAGVPVELAEDLLLARWRKLVWNVPFNGLTVVLDATTRQLMDHRHTRSLCEALMREVAAAAEGYGRRIDEDFLRQMMDYTDRMTPYRPSMKRDYDARRPMELDAIYAAPLRAAHRVGVECPRIETLHQQLALLDERREG